MFGIYNKKIAKVILLFPFIVHTANVYSESRV